MLATTRTTRTTTHTTTTTTPPDAVLRIRSTESTRRAECAKVCTRCGNVISRGEVYNEAQTVMGDYVSYHHMFCLPCTETPESWTDWTVWGQYRDDDDETITITTTTIDPEKGKKMTTTTTTEPTTTVEPNTIILNANPANTAASFGAVGTVGQWGYAAEWALENVSELVFGRDAETRALRIPANPTLLTDDEAAIWEASTYAAEFGGTFTSFVTCVAQELFISIANGEFN